MHHMLEEIESEPAIIESYRSKKFPDLQEILETLSGSKIVYAVGNGSSYHAAVYLSIILNRKGISCLPIYSAEIRNWIRNTGSRSTSVLFSQSGESTDIIDSVKVLRQADSTIIGITNVGGSKLDLASDLKIITDVGKEESIPATKSHISQLLVDLRVSSSGSDEEYRATLDGISMNAKAIIQKKDEIKKLAESLPENFAFLGTGLLYPIALEASLKLLETSNAITYAFPVREFLHGPKQILNQNWSVLMLSEDLKVMNDLERHAGKVLDVAEYLKERFDVWTGDEITHSITSLIFCQLFSYYTAISRSLDPDRPSKLSKIVT